ncbi:hypothetical protein HOLleu_30482 [Holothuria leucospilota]|uniref:Uncharacterized protein n=1 Tax=Holothuria leucospilota TaxID=206669 RepID=A0A9Q1BKG2_HOLLE|nr:hypothetical protein HOLleu_30482 [Holothuria leucospilota]
MRKISPFIVMTYVVRFKRSHLLCDVSFFGGIYMYHTVSCCALTHDLLTYDSRMPTRSGQKSEIKVAFCN